MADNKFENFQMYTDEGNGAVGFMVSTVVRKARVMAHAGNLSRERLMNLLNEGIRDVRLIFPEVSDTEPEWAIVDAINLFCNEVGIGHISRDDLS